jgi:hypothetical protein
VNAETIALIERPYQEIVDDVLTAIVGGVTNEPIFFDVKETLYPLAQPAADVRSITGTRSLTVDGTHKPVRHSFQKEVDFLFDAGRNAVAWESGGLKPDDETIFYVDYTLPDGHSPLTDINVGSVTRTLSEAISREIATVYEQINRAYLSGFVDTATGQSLDLVVAILGVKRKTKESAAGLVTFFRDPAAGDGNIAIPEGLLLSTAKGEATFMTMQLRTLQRGQVRIDVPVRATDTSKGEAGKRQAGEINTLVQPMTGIARVTNTEPTVLGASDETDAELRARAKAVLRGLGKATIAALDGKIRELRGKPLEIWDPNSSPDKRSAPGTVVLLVESEPERFASLQAGVEETRAAGVQATLVARYIFFKPRILVEIPGSIAAAGKLKLIDQIIQALQHYVDGLSAGEPAKGQDLIAAIKSVKEVGAARIVDVMAWQSDVGRPGVEVLVDALLAAIAATVAGDTTALRTTITDVLAVTAPTVPTSRRIPNRDFVQGPGGQRATDGEIETNQFQVVAMVGSEQWWVTLDLEPADIVLVER